MKVWNPVRIKALADAIAGVDQVADSDRQFLAAADVRGFVVRP